MEIVVYYLVKRNSLAAKIELKANFPATFRFSFLIVSNNQNYKETRNGSIQWKT